MSCRNQDAIDGEGLKYLSGFCNHFSSEAINGALPRDQNSPLLCPYGFYAEQISGTSFTSPRCLNQRSWLYRIKPSVTHEPFKPRLLVHGKLVSEFTPINSSTNPTQLRHTICGSGNSFLRHGYAIHMYTANKSMDNSVFCNTDGDFLFVPQKRSGNDIAVSRDFLTPTTWFEDGFR